MCIRRYNFNTKLLKVEDEAKQFNVAISADLMDNKVDVIRKGLQVFEYGVYR